MILGIGTDLHDCRRLEGILERLGQRFLDRVFTKSEQDFCEQRKATRIATYGKTFAAKEACVKALQETQDIGWHDIEVVRLPSGAPTLQLHGQAQKRFEDLVGPGQQGKIHLSLSDELPYAQAFVVISKK